MGGEQQIARRRGIRSFKSKQPVGVGVATGGQQVVQDVPKTVAAVQVAKRGVLETKARIATPRVEVSIGYAGVDRLGSLVELYHEGARGRALGE